MAHRGPVHFAKETSKMKFTRFMAVCAPLLAIGILSGCAEPNRAHARIDPQADEALRKMSATLANAKSFSFQTVATMDEPIASGHLVQSTRQSRLVVHRPDRLYVKSRRPSAVWQMWCADGNLTVFNQAAGAYASRTVPRPIDDMLDTVAREHGLTLPLADLLFSDPYKVLTADALTGRYVGLHEVEGVRCHHLLFTQEAVDWQIWIDAGAKPVPRRFLIDYKTVAERPQFTAVLSEWNLAAPTKDEVFKAVVPAGATKMDLSKLLEAQRGK
jgi:hypothetical protein